MITNKDIQGLLNQNSLNQQDAVNAGLLPARLNPAELETLMGSIPKYQVPPEPIKESRGARITEAIRRMGLAFQGIDPNVADLKRQELELRRMQLQQGKEYKPPSSYQEYTLTDDTPTQEEYKEFLFSGKKAGATSIDFGEKGFAALGPKKYEERLKLATSSQDSNVTIDNLSNLLDQGLQTGFGAEIGTTLNRIGQTLIGPEYKTQEIASAESFLAGATQMILPQVKKLGVNPTDNDLNFVVKASPELTKSVEGNRLMLQALKLSNARAIDSHNFDNSFYGNPDNKGKTEVDRNIAFKAHRENNPEIYSAQILIDQYNNFLESEALKKLGSEEINVDDSLLPPELR